MDHAVMRGQILAVQMRPLVDQQRQCKQDVLLNSSCIIIWNIIEMKILEHQNLFQRWAAFWIMFDPIQHKTNKKQSKEQQ